MIREARILGEGMLLSYTAGEDLNYTASLRRLKNVGDFSRGRHCAGALADHSVVDLAETQEQRQKHE